MDEDYSKHLAGWINAEHELVEATVAHELETSHKTSDRLAQAIRAVIAIRAPSPAKPGGGAQVVGSVPWPYETSEFQIGFREGYAANNADRGGRARRVFRFEVALPLGPDSK